MAAGPRGHDRVRIRRGGEGTAAQAALRFNVATTTGIIPGGVPAGLRYTVSYGGPPAPTIAQLKNATPAGAPASLVIPPPSRRSRSSTPTA